MPADVSEYLRSELSAKLIIAQSRDVFLARYGHLFEHSSWVVERAWSAAPFANAQALHMAFLCVLNNASKEERIALIQAHPQLADKAAIEHGLTASSAAEQASAGLDRLSDAEYESFRNLNAAYRQRFGFPFIICVRLHNRISILAELERRLSNDPGEELHEALLQIGLISKLRLADLAP